MYYVSSTQGPNDISPERADCGNSPMAREMQAEGRIDVRG